LLHGVPHQRLPGSATGGGKIELFFSVNLALSESQQKNHVRHKHPSYLAVLVNCPSCYSLEKILIHSTADTDVLERLKVTLQIGQTSQVQMKVVIIC
jgi:hypothetical protein